MWMQLALLAVLGVACAQAQSQVQDDSVYLGLPWYWPAPGDRVNAGQPTNVGTVAYVNGTTPNATAPIPVLFTLLGADLDSFQGAYPTPSSDGNTTAPVTFPLGGQYGAIVKYYLPSGGMAWKFAPTSVWGYPKGEIESFNPSRVNVTELYTNAVPFSNSMPMVLMSSLRRPEAEAAYRITMDGPRGQACVPGRAMNYTFRVMTANPRRDVTDLQPLWGADAILSVMNRNFNFRYGSPIPQPALVPATPATAARTAQEAGQLGRRLRQALPTQAANAAGRFGPNLATSIVFPDEGVYAIIAQMRRRDDLILAPFYITCGDVDADVDPNDPGHHVWPDPSPAPSSASVAGAAKAAAGVVAAAALAMLW